MGAQESREAGCETKGIEREQRKSQKMGRVGKRNAKDMGRFKGVVERSIGSGKGEVLESVAPVAPLPEDCSLLHLSGPPVLYL